MIGGRIRLALAAAGALVAAVACAGEARGPAPYTIVSADDLERMLGKSDVFVVDANPHDVYLKGHVPGARWWRSAPLAQLLPTDKERRLVFYCASPQ